MTTERRKKNKKRQIDCALNHTVCVEHCYYYMFEILFVVLVCDFV